MVPQLTISARFAACIAFGAVLIQASPLAVPAEDPLAAGFASPPDSAKPRVWWHWMNGNITKEGIRKDLEWMKRIGVGGVQNFDGALDTPQVVEQRLIYMTPEWQDAFRYAVELTDRLGLEFAIASSPGWSETGGPWVKPEDGMKKLVWSVTRVTGGHQFTGKLAEPPSVAGPFQDERMIDIGSQKEVDGPRFYRDVAAIAYRTPNALQHDPKPVKVITSASSGPTVSGEQATKRITLPISNNKPAWLLYDYGEPQRFRAATLSTPNSLYCTWVVEAGDDGETFRKVGEWPPDYSSRRATIVFPQVTARFVRLKMTSKPYKSWFDLSANAPGAIPAPYLAPIDSVTIDELRFYTGARVHRFEDKAGFSIAGHYYKLDSDASNPDEVVSSKDIINLTERMHADGSLNWIPPSGEWTVLRLGYSLTGATNYPASPEATGLEVDKLDQGAVRRYLDAYLGSFEKTVGAERIGKRGIRAFLTDSIESSGENWTPRLIEEFKERRGYDPTLWLPALTGVTLSDSSRTDRFLWDFRKTLMELISDAHYRQVAQSARQRGLLYYGESLEGYPTMALGDDLDMRQHADIPMAAIWTSYKKAERDGLPYHIVDMRGAASVGHVFGKDLVAAESLTSGFEPWAFSPSSLKPVIDLAFALGVNRPVIHTSVHQPVEKKPGMTLGPYGQQFSRHESWAELAEPWMTYLSRTSYLLQQGRFVADVAYFYGEEGPLSDFSDALPPDVPESVGFDLINANMLRNHLRARDGRLVSTGGASYRLLYLGGTSERMTLPVLRKLKECSDAGIRIAGKRPTGSPSLADENHEAEYRQIVAQLWDSGKVVPLTEPTALLARLGITPDFDYGTPKSDARVMFVHRQLADGDLYFLSNRRARPERIEARFRVRGRAPELWHADTGVRERVSWRTEQGLTIVPLDLAANESLFVVFREPTDGTREDFALPRERFLTRIVGDWRLSFEPDRGAPANAISTRLGSWAESDDPGIKYFSGLGTYRKTFNLRPAELKGEGRVLLDLGQVHELAEVRLNGKRVGYAWHTPFRLDVTDAMTQGTNVLEIRVANLWVNRLIGDKQPGAKPVAFTVTTTYQPDAPLRPSGLIGPVTLVRRAP